MKKRKLTLGLAALLTAVGGLAACNEVTYKEGVVLEFNDGTSVIKYTADELLGEYQKSSSGASTQFDKVKEVLIRNYYAQDKNKSVLATLKAEATKDVNDILREAAANASTNGTTYAEELEKKYNANGVETYEELFDKKLYEQEKARFENDFYLNSKIENMRDGTYVEGSTVKETFPYSENYGRGNPGYLKDKMPYHISHILVKLDSAEASKSDYTQNKISADQSRKISTLVKALAGAVSANNTDGFKAESTRSPFSSLANTLSEDTGSKADWGNLGIVDKDTTADYVQEFKFGVYGFEAIYSKLYSEANKTTTGKYAYSQVSDGVRTRTVKDGILPTEDMTIYAEHNDGQGGKDYGDVKVTKYLEEVGIGMIPFGAAVALGYDTISEDPDLGASVNDNDKVYYPRNVLFNKYFNNHQVAVIVPTRIASNAELDGKTTAGLVTADAFNKSLEESTKYGVIDTDYQALPGFAKDTSGTLDLKIGDTPVNALTDEAGRIILAVRAGASSYDGIHFITITRSALDQYVEYNEANNTYTRLSETDYAAKKDTTNSTSLSEYYTIYEPSKIESGYPYYTEDLEKVEKKTYVNQFKQSTATPYQTRADAVSSAVKGYNSEIDTYMFQSLMNEGTITFTEKYKSIGEQISNYIKQKREKSVYDYDQSFNESWRTFAETLSAQNDARKLNDDGSQKLISETCVLGYGSSDSLTGTGSVWGQGGACSNKAK